MFRGDRIIREGCGGRVRGKHKVYDSLYFKYVIVQILRNSKIHNGRNKCNNFTLFFFYKKLDKKEVAIGV